MDKGAGNKISDKRLSDDARKAVEAGEDIQDTVRQITIKALTRGQLDTASMRRVAKAVMGGASQGAARHGAMAREALEKAAAGVDEAFATAAQAATLAAKEASARAREFTSHDLRRVMDDLREYETVYLDSLRDAIKGAAGLSGATLRGLAEHAAVTGTAVRRQIDTSLRELGKQVGSAAEATLRDNIQTGKARAARLAQAAAGFLAGIAESLETGAERRKPDRSKVDGKK
jgi:hypothetical protein